MLTTFAYAKDSNEERGLAVENTTQIKADIAVFPQLGHTHVRSAAFSPDEKQILSCSDDYTIKLWDVANGREIKTFSGHTGNVLSAMFSMDGKQVLSSSADGSIRLWDAASGREINTFLGHEGFVYSVAFSPDGKQIISGSEDGTIKLWDTESGVEIRTFFESKHRLSVTTVAYSPNGKQILSCLEDETIMLWDAVSGLEIRTFKGHNWTINSATFSPDGKQVLSGSSDKTIKLWDVASGREIRTLSGHTDHVNSVAFSPDGKQALSGSDDYTVKLWDVASGKEIKTFLGHNDFFNSVAFSSDGKKILTGSSDGKIKLWDVASGREIRIFSGLTSNVLSATFSPDGKKILTGSYDKTIKLWDITSGREIRTFSGHTMEINSIAFSPNGKQVLSGSNDGTVKQWDVASGKEIKTFTGHIDSVLSVAFSPNGKQVLSVSGTKDFYSSSVNKIKLWDAASGKEIRTFSGHTSSVLSVAFSPNGKQVLSGYGSKLFDYSSDNNYQIKLWDVASGKEIRTFSGHSDSVLSVAFSSDGKQIISGSEDGTIKLWDVASGRVIRTFSESSYGDDYDIYYSVAFSPDGKQVLSGSSDGSINLWNVASGQEIRTFSGHTSQVWSVSFSPDGTRILSSSSDTTTRIWDVTSGKEIAQFISFTGSDTQLASASRGLTVETETAATSNSGEWLSITPDGYYQASPRGDRYINVRVNNTVSGIDSYRSIFYNPDVVQARLQGKPDPVSKANITIKQAANFMPPTVTIQSPANLSATNTATANLSVTITDKNQSIKNIKIIVNGRLISRDELSAVKGNGLQAQKASLTVTGNQKTVNLSLPLNLDPGNNRIEIVAFNGFSDSRSYIDIIYNAPAEQKPVLPNLWILAVGVNKYNDSNIRNLNYCVADAKGVIESLKAQEGKRYAKVNSLLIADGETVAPTAANIKQNLKFLDGAGERDVVLLFLAGHGVSDNAGKFLFLPNDVKLKVDKTVNEASAISDSEIVSVLDRAGNLLVFIDACQSGGVDNDRLVRSLMDTNAFVFTSSRGNELSQERKEFGHGVFTYSIMQGLKGATQALAQNNVTVLSLSGFVSLDVPRITGGAQNPKAYSLGFYDFPMALINAPR
ncbi:WD40 domain-containing protein [Treponema sp. R80B11-R83G3]